MTLRRLLLSIVNLFKKTPVAGVPDVEPGETTDVDGVGDTHSGRYYVDEVSHNFESDDYDQQFDLDRNATSNEPESNDK